METKLKWEVAVAPWTPRRDLGATAMVGQEGLEAAGYVVIAGGVGSASCSQARAGAVG